MSSNFIKNIEETPTDINEVYKNIDWEKVDEDGSILHLTGGTDANGKEYYAYMAIKPSLYKEFHEKSLNDETININDYGIVIESGFGALPPPEVQKKMADEYGFSANFENEITSFIEKESEKAQK